MDSKLFKEAIADAKAVRQTALANAKVALEEAFSERYRSMFAEKLKEDAAMEDTKPAGMNQEEKVSESEIEELIKELESEVGGPNAQPPMEDPSAAGAGAPPMDAGAGALPMGAEAGAAPMPPLVPPSTPGAGCFPPGTSFGGAGAGAPPMPVAPEAPPMGAPAGAGGPPPSDVPPAGPEEDENVDLDELLETLKEEIKEGYKEAEEEEEGKTIDEQTKLATSGIGSGKAGGSPNKKPSSAASSTSKIETAANDDEGMPSLDQPKVVAKESTQAPRPNQAKNATKDNLSTPSMGGSKGSGGQTETGMPKTDQAKTTAKEATQANRPNQAKNATATNLSTPGGMLEENKQLKAQLEEATSAIKYVKGQLNEINLLNAKLLYTNKLFKEYSLNNEHKMRIVEMFDLAKNVREVKLTYANLAESMNFGGVDQKRKVAVTNTSLQSITEGLGSKAIGSTKPGKDIITESKSAMVTKFQKLAGIGIKK